MEDKNRGLEDYSMFLLDDRWYLYRFHVDFLMGVTPSSRNAPGFNLQFSLSSTLGKHFPNQLTVAPRKMLMCSKLMKKKYAPIYQLMTWMSQQSRSTWDKPSEMVGSGAASPGGSFRGSMCSHSCSRASLVTQGKFQGPPQGHPQDPQPPIQPPILFLPWSRIPEEVWECYGFRFLGPGGGSQYSVSMKISWPENTDHLTRQKTPVRWPLLRKKKVHYIPCPRFR